MVLASHLGRPKGQVRDDLRLAPAGAQLAELLERPVTALGETTPGELPDDAVILRGRNYAPEEIERAVEEVPGLRAASAVAVSWLPEDARGEELALFVEASRQAAPEELAALPDACREAVLGATGLAVDRLEVLAPGTLPRTSSGKLRRGETLRLYLAGELALLDPAPALTGALA